MDNAGVRSYDKYYLKKHPGTGEVLLEGKKPILVECAKHDCRLEPRHVITLNRGWQNSGVYFVEVIKKTEDIPVEKKQALKGSDEIELGSGLEKEVNLVKKTKRELVAECKKLEIEANGNVTELTERLANHKG